MVDPFITVQDIVDQANDYVSNYTTGNVDLGNRIRAVNRSIEFIKRRMTFPSDEVIQRFNFYEGQTFYNLEEDFNEGLQLVYDNEKQNHPGNNWDYTPYGNILSKQGLRPGKKYFSWTGINGQMQLMMKGHNLVQGAIQQTFDNTNAGFVAENDAQNVRIDTNIYTEGSGSLAFDINPALGGSGMASVIWPTTADYTRILQNSGLFNLDVWLPDGNISEINLVLLTDSLDYYTLSASTFNDGTAFSTALNQWKTIALGFVGDAVVGSPAINNILDMRVDVVLNGSFGSSIVDDFRIDNLRTVVPDYMDLIYLSAYKGTDSTGTTNKIFLTEYTDIPAFQNFIPDMLDVVSLKVATILAPQILSNSEFRAMYKADFEEVMNTMGKSWPRKRALNMGRLVLSRS